MRANAKTLEFATIRAPRRWTLALSVAFVLAGLAVGWVELIAPLAVRALEPPPPASNPPAIHMPAAPDWTLPAAAPVRDAAAVARLRIDGWRPQGWGFTANLRPAAVDPSAGVGPYGPYIRPGEFEVGFGWQDREMSAVLGLAEPDYGPRFDIRQTDRSPAGRVGLTITLHPR